MVEMHHGVWVLKLFQSQKFTSMETMSLQEYRKINSSEIRKFVKKKDPKLQAISKLVENKEFVEDKKPSRVHKFNTQKAVIDGISFDSIAESKRYSELKMLARLNEISDLKMQVAYPLEINGVLIAKYIADFTYVKNGVVIVEDVKGYLTPVYRLKKKLMKAVHGIDIYEHYQTPKKINKTKMFYKEK